MYVLLTAQPNTVTCMSKRDEDSFTARARTSYDRRFALAWSVLLKFVPFFMLYCMNWAGVYFSWFTDDFGCYSDTTDSLEFAVFTSYYDDTINVSIVSLYSHKSNCYLCLHMCKLRLRDMYVLAVTAVAEQEFTFPGYWWFCLLWWHNRQHWICSYSGDTINLSIIIMSKNVTYTCMWVRTTVCYGDFACYGEFS